MINNIDSIFSKYEFSYADVVYLLKTEAEERRKLFQKADEVKSANVGNKVYFRGLIEYSNICSKDCYYCGIRKSNKNVTRYRLTEEEVLNAVKYAYEQNFASIVLQGGEVDSPKFTEEIESLLKKIMQITNGEIGITLSLGEQNKETLLRWKNAGAKRYLLRIETSNKDLYSKIHPKDTKHQFENRIKSLELLRECGYQVGSGVMVGLPFQTIEDLANDLIFLRDFDIDMVGLGPYIEHEQTPLFEFRNTLWDKNTRFDLSLKMIAILRIMMKDINIAATTAMQAIDKIGREKALKVGANIIMPNLTPLKYRENYLLYEDKPCIDEEADECKNCLEARIKFSGNQIGYGEHGDSLHYKRRTGLI